jgi:hypothetical protein
VSSEVTWKGNVKTDGLVSHVEGDIGKIWLVDDILWVHVVFVANNELSRFLSEAR